MPALLGCLGDLARCGHFAQVAKNRFFLPEAVLELAGLAVELAAGPIDHRFGAAAYRDRSGPGRNLTSEVVEFFVRAGVTRFEAGRRGMAEAAAAAACSEGKEAPPDAGSTPSPTGS